MTDVESGTVAAISRQLSMLAVRCADGRYSLLRFDEDWTPAIGEEVVGELRHRGERRLRVGNGSTQRVEIQSVNCSAPFAQERLRNVG